jgi:hypothetical protein
MVFSGLIPDLDHFCGWGGGGVRPLWRDPGGTIANIAPGLLSYLGRQLEIPITPLDLLAYVAALVSHPGFTRRFERELAHPGVRVPLSAQRSVWIEAISVGCEVIWLHTFGTRYVDATAGRPLGEGALIERYGVKCLSAIMTLPEQMPDQLEYDVDSRTLLIGEGAFSPVAHEILDYRVGDRRILWRWLNDRARKPRNKRRSSRLDDLRGTSWSRLFTDELLALLSVLTGCVELHSIQRELLDRVCDGPLLSVTNLRSAGVIPVDPVLTRPPRLDAPQ